MGRNKYFLCLRDGQRVLKAAACYPTLVLYSSLPKTVFLSLNFQLLLRKQIAFISQVLNRDFDVLKQTVQCS